MSMVNTVLVLGFPQGRRKGSAPCGNRKGCGPPRRAGTQNTPVREAPKDVTPGSP